jgi:nucleotide-binding universal stress UspA family protein
LKVDGDQHDERGLEHVRQTLTARRVREQPAAQDDVVEAVLAEANLGYGAIAVGAADSPTSDRPLPDFIEDLLNRSPIPLLVVRRGTGALDEAGRPVIRPRRILVPVTGNAASRAGQEVAQMIGRNTGADLTLLHVVTRPAADRRQPARQAARDSTASAVVGQAQRDARDKDLAADTIVRDAASSGAEIERAAQETGAELVIVGTTVRRVADRPFLGHTVEHLLERVSDPTVVIVVLPDAQQAAADEHIDRRTG